MKDIRIFFLPLITVKTLVIVVLRGVENLSRYTKHPLVGPFLFFLELGLTLKG
jgi:hypothetical protein